MKYKICFISLLCAFFSKDVNAQAFLKTEYIMSSPYRDENNDKTGGKGDLKVVQAGFQIPLSVKMNERNRPTAWAIGLGSSYGSMNNKNMDDLMDIKNIFNAQVGVMHLRPLNDKWSLLASVGVGLYADADRMREIGFKQLLGSGGAIAIYHWLPDLDIGIGLAMNNSFGYPMVFPAMYLNWELDGRYMVNARLMDAMEISAGIDLHKHFRLKLIAEANGMMALTERDDKDVIFTQQYITVGLQPELRLGHSISIPVTLGFSAVRNAYYTKRTLKAFFKDMDREYDPYFSITGYGALAIRYGF